MKKHPKTFRTPFQTKKAEAPEQIRAGLVQFQARNPIELAINFPQNLPLNPKPQTPQTRKKKKKDPESRSEGLRRFWPQLPALGRRDRVLFDALLRL